MSTMGGKFIGPRDNRSLKIFGFARKYLKFQEQKRVIGQTKGNFLIGRMTKADALINRTAPPPLPNLEKCGGYMENDSGLSNETSNETWGDYHSLARSLFFM